jgi:hypothetical protein
MDGCLGWTLGGLHRGQSVLLMRIQRTCVLKRPVKSREESSIAEISKIQRLCVWRRLAIDCPSPHHRMAEPLAALKNAWFRIDVRFCPGLSLRIYHCRGQEPIEGFLHSSSSSSSFCGGFVSGCERNVDLCASAHFRRNARSIRDLKSGPTEILSVP